MSTKIKTIKQIQQSKIDSAISSSAIMEAARTWQPKHTKLGRKSVLENYIDTIRYLRSSRKMTYRNILEFFNTNNIKISYANLIRFATANKIGGSKQKCKQKTAYEL